MFESLTERLGKALKGLSGQVRLTEDNIKDTLRELRMALLEADVALPVVKAFTEQVKERAVGTEVLKSLNPSQVFLKIVHEELMKVMGEANEKLNLATKPPAIVLMAGLQGAGKTTTVGKLAKYLQEREKKKVMVVSADVYRPAAIKQLETLAKDVGALFYPSDINQKPVDIAKAAIDAAQKAFADVLLVDTAGRLAIDSEMMAEIQTLHKAINPIETLFVVDAMTGQDAANTAKAFNEALPLTGVILTKADGDARGGAALSVRHITGKPIKFMGMGEKTDALEPFHPDRVASRILDLGDVLSLIEQAERTIDKAKADKLAKKIKTGKGFDLEDFLDQIQQMKKMGGLTSMLDKLPGMGNMGNMGNMAKQTDAAEKNFKQMEAIIRSMTPAERRNPDLINGSRKKRIAAGSGNQIQDINRVLKQHDQMQKMMKKMTAPGGMRKMMRAVGGMAKGGNPFGGMGGGMPPLR
jgi:signal recognition particle subunit SRP54